MNVTFLNIFYLDAYPSFESQLKYCSLVQVSVKHFLNFPNIVVHRCFFISFTAVFS